MSVVSNYIGVDVIIFFFSVCWLFIFKTADFFDRQLLHPLSVDCTASSVLVQEVPHRQGVVVLFLGKRKIRSHWSANVFPHFVKGLLENTQIIIGQELFDLIECSVFLDFFHSFFGSVLRSVDEVVHRDSVAAWEHRASPYPIGERSRLLLLNRRLIGLCRNCLI